MTSVRGSGLPFCDIWEATTEAESAVVMKKTASITITMPVTTAPPGRVSATTKKISSGAGRLAAVPSGAIV